jgi:hypothetical protein
MFDLSRFGKELKQRYSQEYKTRQQRTGPLWEERFKSVLVENDSRILLRVAAYIDLNPLRAGLCGDPKDYRFCGYAGAVAGDPHCMQGMRRLFSLLRLDVDGGIAEAFAAYRVALFGKARPDVGRTKGKGRAGLSPNAIDAVKRGKGLLGLKEVLGVRLRYMSEGIALGTAIFVEDQAKRFSILCGRKRMPRFERDPREDIAIWCFPRQMGTDPRGG